MKCVYMLPRLLILCICIVLVPKTAHAKNITIGNYDCDLSWDNIGLLKETLSAGDTVIITTPPENTAKAYVMHITQNNVTIQSEKELELQGFSIHGEDIDKISLKDIRLSTPNGMNALELTSDEPFSYHYAPNARQQAVYSDPTPITICIEGDVKLICGIPDTPTAADGGTAIYSTNSIIIEGSGNLEAIGGIGADTGGNAIFSFGNITLKAKVTGTGGSVPAEYRKGGWRTGGNGIYSYTDIHVYSDCIFSGGQPGGNGLSAYRYFNIYEGGSVSAQGADDAILGGYGAYCYGGATIGGVGYFGGGDGQYGGGDGFYVYYDNFNVTGILNSWGGNAMGEDETPEDNMAGGNGIWTSAQSIDFYGNVTAVGGKSAVGVGGNGIITLRSDINLYGTLSAIGGDGKTGVVSYGSGVYISNIEDGALVFQTAEAKAAITNGENYRAPFTHLPLRKGGNVQTLLWHTEDNVLSGVFSDNLVAAAGKKFVIALDGGLPQNDTSNIFTDITGHWAEDIIIEATKNGIIAGVGNNKFDPDRSISRAEFIHLVNKIAKLSDEINGSVFEDIDSYFDVNRDDWYYESVTALKSAGILDGIYGAQYLDPDLYVSREQMAGIIANILQYRDIKWELDDIKSLFEDYERITPAYRDAVESVAALEIMAGIGGGNFDPDGTVNRAQAATVLLNAMDYLILQ